MGFLILKTKINSGTKGIENKNKEWQRARTRVNKSCIKMPKPSGGG